MNHVQRQTPQSRICASVWRAAIVAAAFIGVFHAAMLAQDPFRPVDHSPARESDVPEQPADPFVPSSVPIEHAMGEEAIDTEDPLYAQERADLITLKDADKTVIEVLPIDFPGRTPPAKPRSMDTLIVRLIDEPGAEYQLRWLDIAGIEMFENRVLAQANQLVDQGRHDEAFAYFEFLRSEYPKMSELPRSLVQFLWNDALALAASGRHDNALVNLYEIYSFSPGTPGLEEFFAREIGALVERYTSNEDFASARALLQELVRRFPQSGTIAQWRARWAELARERVSAARIAMDESRFRDAQLESLAALERDPSSVEAREVIAEAFKQYPRIAVGIMTPCAAFDDRAAGRTPELADWAVRRDKRLVTRTLFEYAGPGPEGGLYRSPVADSEYLEIDRRLVLRLRQDLNIDEAGRPLTGYDVARRLLSMADPLEHGYRDDWRGLLNFIDVRDVFTIDVSLARPHVRPERLLEIDLGDSFGGARSSAAGPLAAYEAAGQSDERWTMMRNARYFEPSAEAPQEITQMFFVKGRDALAALRSGEVSVVDRINPWDVARLASDDDLIVDRYAAPTVHVLIPSSRHPLTARRSFRRALAYGIDRRLILNRHLLRDSELQGCQVISGPFTAGLGFSDSQRYAHNDAVPIRPYDPRLAMTLAATAVHETRLAVDDADLASGDLEIAELTLAHPDHEIAATACAAIQRHLAAIGVPVVLRPVRGAPPVGEDADLVYAELVMSEPVVDARRLLGDDGLVGHASSYVRLALDQLDSATGWNEVRQRLYDVHRIVADELPLIPLWQLSEHYVRYKSVQGIGERPVTLFQNVDQWRAQPRLAIGSR